MGDPPSLTLSCRSKSRSLMISCLSSAGMRSAGHAVSSVSTRLLQDRRAFRFALRLLRTRLRSTTCCRMEFTSWKNSPRDKDQHGQNIFSSVIPSVNSGKIWEHFQTQHCSAHCLMVPLLPVPQHDVKVPLVLVHPPPLTGASVQWLPFLAVH